MTEEFIELVAVDRIEGYDYGVSEQKCRIATKRGSSKFEVSGQAL
jgi:hypothetical protein